MNRRHCLQALAATPLVSGAAPAAGKPIQLHVDLEVDPAKEDELAANFERVFRPAISRQPGFVEVKLLKLRNALAGTPPPNMRYRLIISFQTEELRQKWVATDDHQAAWPEIEKTLTGAKYTAFLYDAV